MAFLNLRSAVLSGIFTGKAKAPRECDPKDFPGPVLKIGHFFFSL